MHTDIRTLNIDRSASVNAHVVERLNASLSHFASRIESVDVRLEDTHGARHGRVMRCQLRVHVAGAGAITIDHRDPDIFRAIDEAMRRAKRVLHRRIGRSRLFAHDRSSGRCAA